MTNHDIINQPRSILSMIVILMTAPIFFLIMPLYVGSLMDTLSLNHQQLGWIVTTELGGVALASLLSMMLVRTFSWRHSAIIAASILLLCNILSLLVSGNYSTFILVRFFAGLSSGYLIAISFVALGDTQHNNRNISYGIVGQLVVMSILLFLLPHLMAKGGLDAVLTTFIGTSIIAIVFAFFLPHSGLDLEAIKSARKGNTLTPLWGLLGTFCFFISVTSFWAFIERIGSVAGFSKTFIGTALGAATGIAV